MPIIWPFQPADAEAISALIRQTMERSSTHDYPLARLRPLMDYFTPSRLLVLSKERHCLVAEDAGILLGTASLEANQIRTFFVHPDHQRKGTGTQLLRALEQAATLQNVPSLTAEASLTGVTFYESQGYTRTGKQREGVAGVHIEVEKPMRLSPNKQPE